MYPVCPLDSPHWSRSSPRFQGFSAHRLLCGAQGSASLLATCRPNSHHHVTNWKVPGTSSRALAARKRPGTAHLPSASNILPWLLLPLSLSLLPHLSPTFFVHRISTNLFPSILFPLLPLQSSTLAAHLTQKLLVVTSPTAQPDFLPFAPAHLKLVESPQKNNTQQNLRTTKGAQPLSPPTLFLLVPHLFENLNTSRDRRLSPPVHQPRPSKLSFFPRDTPEHPNPFAEADDDTGDIKKVENHIHIRIQQRNGRKSLTTVTGLPAKFDPGKILTFFRKEFACNGNKVNDEKAGEVIQLQGDQRKKVMDFLVDKKSGLGLNPDNITVHGA
ncbi:uncharacterized protein Triagg1_3706 [Trichoderma aggressivum f. europaeum]|uniref:SUI1 domain-containing protein n=1 Tax=Trichoderma aggressivum f. europaeum TaxID=173218 RepID=A0AAE1IHZ9_9HYPO|nr:hypothetical protein Triagg1_3706 [Trichoderma aggressivum f. europaeum]